jgi:hypothetical protein
MTQDKKRVILTFGCLSGLVSAGLMFATIPFMEKIGSDRAMVVGYTAMVISFLFVFFGVRAYRESLEGSPLTFGNAFAVGLLITLISCVFYVVAWKIVNVYFMPDFWTKYSERLVGELRASGASDVVIEAKTREIAGYANMNPLLSAAFVFIEPFPVGLLMTLVSAIALRRKSSAEPAIATRR